MSTTPRMTAAVPSNTGLTEAVVADVYAQMASDADVAPLLVVATLLPVGYGTRLTANGPVRHVAFQVLEVEPVPDVRGDSWPDSLRSALRQHIRAERAARLGALDVEGDE